MSNKGTLFIVATPIGNMKDFTKRAVEVLKDVDLILSEDTRETKKLLDSYNLTTDQISYRDQNHKKVFPRILDLLSIGKDLALVSDSGTPLISDPGFKLVQEVIRADYEVVTIPGPSAVISALSISGLPTDKFVFLGFLPKGRGQRAKILKEYGKLDATLVIYESPHRLEKILKDISDSLGNRYVALCGELTKMHEKCIRGFADDLLDMTTGHRGEYVVLIAKEGYHLDV
ncbi:16S rRNA (cytidine(1402)-2'-O)-methyltransferase [candidate division WWE3 bacterium]|jgi:16S rRNA (cytidine1402-2'-O)-methyltransferase|nr:16S rRNA (cytidine(1402)-2'-O)-methyltransferase [candidate division WWE3 bacterium]MBT7349349.1 16S rRNA (cytidine(1402)-2'-O)-methyltransferase [candidate division WWE3 bacterium]